MDALTDCGRRVYAIQFARTWPPPGSSRRSRVWTQIARRFPRTDPTVLATVVPGSDKDRYANSPPGPHRARPRWCRVWTQIVPAIASTRRLSWQRAARRPIGSCLTTMADCAPIGALGQRLNASCSGSSIRGVRLPHRSLRNGPTRYWSPTALTQPSLPTTNNQQPTTNLIPEFLPHKLPAHLQAFPQRSGGLELGGWANSMATSPENLILCKRRANRAVVHVPLAHGLRPKSFRRLLIAQVQEHNAVAVTRAGTPQGPRGLHQPVQIWAQLHVGYARECP